MLSLEAWLRPQGYKHGLDLVGLGLDLRGLGLGLDLVDLGLCLMGLGLMKNDLKPQGQGPAA